MQKILNSKRTLPFLLVLFGVMTLWSLPELTHLLELNPLISLILGLAILTALVISTWRMAKNSKHITHTYRRYSAAISSKPLWQFLIVASTGFLCIVLITLLMYTAFAMREVTGWIAGIICLLIGNTCSEPSGYTAVFFGITLLAIFILGLFILRLIARLSWLVAAETALLTALAWPLSYTLVPQIWPNFHIYGPFIFVQLYLLALVGFPIHWLILKFLTRSRILGIIVTLILAAIYIGTIIASLKHVGA